jgi:hypothetical protein
MNVEIGTEDAQLLFWEYINGIFVAVCIYLNVHYNLSTVLRVTCAVYRKYLYNSAHTEILHSY